MKPGSVSIITYLLCVLIKIKIIIPSVKSHLYLFFKSSLLFIKNFYLLKIKDTKNKKLFLLNIHFYKKIFVHLF